MRPQIFLHPGRKTIWIFCWYLCCFTLNKLCPLYPKVSFSKFNQASVFTSIFPSAIFKVPPKFPHFLNFIAKYSILGAQCYSSGKSYSWCMKFSMIGGIHHRFFFISLLKNQEFQSSLPHHSSYRIRLTSSLWYLQYFTSRSVDIFAGI